MIFSAGEGTACYYIISGNGQFINNDTAVEQPNSDLGLVSLVLVAHFVWIRSFELRLLYATLALS